MGLFDMIDVIISVSRFNTFNTLLLLLVTTTLRRLNIQYIQLYYI
jgi:hypothetical protein